MNKNNVIIVGLLGLLLGGVVTYIVVSGDTAVPEVVDNTNGGSNTDNTPPLTTEKPGVPAATTRGASSISQSTAVLNANVNPNGVQTSYQYEYGLGTSLGSFTALQLLGGGYSTSSTPAVLSGLTANTPYYYRIVAKNEYGITRGSTMDFKTNNTPPVPGSPATAQTSSASNIEKNSATLNGITNPRGFTTFYWFEYGETPSLGKTTASGSVGASSSNTSVSSNIAGLDANKVYYFRLNTQNGYGVANGNILNFTTKTLTPPPTPVVLPVVTTDSANNIQKTSATLRGQVDPNGIQTSYYFEYGKSELLGIVVLDQKTTSKSAGSGQSSVSASQNITGLDSDSLYYYRLVGENKNGTIRGAIHSFTTRN